MREDRRSGRNDGLLTRALAAAQTLHISPLSLLGERHIEKLVVGSGVDTLDDGEAATIALALQLRGVAILDERKGHRLCRQLFPDLQVGWTVDLFSNSKVQAHLGNEQLAVALYQALRDARMSVPQSHLPWLIGLIGADRASECSSLPKWQAAI